MIKNYTKKYSCIGELLRISEMNLSELQGDDLSRLIVEASQYMFQLSDLVARAIRESNKAYAYRKFQYAKTFSKLKQEFSLSVKETENKTQEENEQNVADEIEIKYHADILKGFYDNSERMIMAMQSRLNYLKSERINNAQT